MAIVTFEQLTAEDAQKLFLVDAHLVDPPDKTHKDKDDIKLTGTLRIMSLRSNRFKWCQYKVGPWDHVFLVWPFKWKAPAPNRLGWLPKCEFGKTGPYFNDVNPDLDYPIEPFSYIDHEGEEYTPDSPAEAP